MYVHVCMDASTLKSVYSDVSSDCVAPKDFSVVRDYMGYGADDPISIENEDPSDKDENVADEDEDLTDEDDLFR